MKPEIHQSDSEPWTMEQYEQAVAEARDAELAGREALTEAWRLAQDQHKVAKARWRSALANYHESLKQLHAAEYTYLIGKKAISDRLVQKINEFRQRLGEEE